jgi:hypothetical protein
MLTILALFHRYAGGDAPFLLSHFGRAKALADWLAFRRALATNFSEDDVRYGIPAGNDEGDNFNSVYFRARRPRPQHHSPPPSADLRPRLCADQHPMLHFYSSAAETYRAFTEIGQVWAEVGAAAGRDDVSAHGAALLRLAPLLHRDLHASLNRTVRTTAEGHRCYPDVAEDLATRAGQMSTYFRGYRRRATADRLPHPSFAPRAGPPHPLRAHPFLRSHPTHPPPLAARCSTRAR